VPFREVYIHALVRDAERQKMSKTKGNVLDPIEVTEKYGTDAVRFTLAAMASPGTDIAFNEERTKGYRNFANKIWNAARLMFMNIDGGREAGIWKQSDLLESVSGGALPDSAPLEDRWIEARFQQTALAVNQSLAEYRFDQAANLFYEFFWDDFCAWYLEATKLRLDFALPEKARAALSRLVKTFEASLRLLSPIMPFITEEIWHALYEGKAPAKSIALSRYPAGAELDRNQLAVLEQMQVLQQLIVDVRNRRAELNVEPKLKVPIRIFAPHASTISLIQNNRELVERLGTVESIEFARESFFNTPGVHATNSYELLVVYEKKIDEAAERERLSKEVKKLESELANARRQLGNESFLAKAPAPIVEGLRRRHAELEQLLPKTKGALEQLARTQQP
jgi:valyl-tRNA synthetase